MSVMFDTDGLMVARLTQRQAAGLFVLIAQVVPRRWGRDLAELSHDLLMVLDTTEDDVTGYLKHEMELVEPGLMSFSLRPTKRKLPKLDPYRGPGGPGVQDA